MEKNSDERLRQAIFEVIRNQIRDNQPPATKQTLVRLRSEGFSEDEALKLIGYVVAKEVLEVLGQGRRYDEEKFVAALHGLPHLPWETEQAPGE